MYRIIVCLILIIHGVISANVEEKIQQYFKNDVYKSYQKHWQAHKNSFENAIASALKENYGLRSMNVFVRRSANMLQISNGFYVSDNVVDVLLREMTLTGLPTLIRPEVTFALASNVLRLEAGLSKIIIESFFLQYRNQSDIVFDVGSDLYKHSPFSYQQVERTGRLAVIADECSLVGYGLVKLSGQTVNLGHNTYTVNDCKFTVEISSPRSGSPPIIVPYFTPEQARKIEIMMSKPIIDEMLPKLQATIFTVLNTSVIFDNYLSKFRNYQNNIYKEAVNYVNQIVKNINSATVDSNQVTIKLPKVTKLCNMTCSEGSCYNYMLIENVTVHGLDTLYSSHTGGPFKLKSPKIAESLRFNSLMVRGALLYENNTIQAEHDFAAEIRDMGINFEIDLEKLEAKFNVLQWRSIVFSIIESQNHSKDRSAISAFIHGYLSNELAKALEGHLYSMYDKRSKEKELSDTTNMCVTYPPTNTT